MYVMKKEKSIPILVYRSIAVMNNNITVQQQLTTLIKKSILHFKDIIQIW